MRATVTDVQYGNTVETKVYFNNVLQPVIKTGSVTFSKKANLLSGVQSCDIETDGTTAPAVNTVVRIDIVVNGTTLTMFNGIVIDSTINTETKTITVQAEGPRIFEKEISAHTSVLDYTFMNQDGPDLPIVFGSGVKYPVPEAFSYNKMTLQTPIADLTTLCLIDGGENEEQATTMDLLINGIVVEGQFNNNEFTISEFNKPYYQNLTLTTVVDETGTLASGELLVDHFVYSEALDFVNYCWKQSGTTCYFVLPWPVADNSTVTIDETSMCQRPEWGVEFNGMSYIQNWVYLFEDRCVLPPGAKVVKFNALAHMGKYVINVMPDTTVVCVYAYAQIGGLRQLVPVPPSLYTVANETITGVGSCTTIKIWPPLSNRPNSPYEDDIIVTARSPVARTATATATWLAQYAGGTLSGSFGAWSVDSVFYGNHKVNDLLDQLAYETCTPIRIDGTVVTVVSSGVNKNATSDNMLSEERQLPNEYDNISQIKSGWRPNYSLPIRYYIKKGTNVYLNEQSYDYNFITNKTQVVQSTDWWYQKLTSTPVRYNYVLDHTFYSVEIFDSIINREVEDIQYDFVEPRVSVSCLTVPTRPTAVAQPDPAKNITQPLFFLSTVQDSGSGATEEPATQGWVWDGNTVFTGSPNIYGCKKYVGANILAENPSPLPSIGTNETAGDYTSGVAGICRVQIGVDGLGRKKFVLAYSPSCPYWLITDQTVVLGSPLTVSGKQVYPIVWGL